MKKINIFLMFKREGTISLLTLVFKINNIIVVGTCTQPSLAKERLAKCDDEPDIILMDANWPPGSDPKKNEGLELLKKFLKANYRVIALTSYYEKRIADLYKENGAQGYIYRGAPIQEILSCIAKVHEGGISYPIPLPPHPIEVEEICIQKKIETTKLTQIGKDRLS